MEKKEIGVITEQGYVAGNGLGYTPIKEEDLNLDKEEETNK